MYNIGPKIGIDGEREFRADIKKINDTYRALEAETKAVTAAFEAQGDEQGKLEALSKQLQKQIAEQQKKMVLLDDAVKKASAQFGESSIEATRLRGALFDTQATVTKLEGELKDTNARLSGAGEAMEEFAEETKDAADAAIDFGDILAANVISDVIMDGLRDLAEEVKDFAVGSIEAAAEVKAASSQMEQTFGDMEASAKASLKKISDDTNIATTRMQGSFTKIYAFAKTSGAGAAESLTVASRAMVAAADNAAYLDKSIEEATEQIQSFIKGNYENDAALGISATETSRNTKANELYAKSFQELSEAQKVDVLLAMVEAGNAASGALGQAAREADSWENVTGELAEVMRQLQAEAGKPALKKLVPIIQKITDAGYELIEDTDWDKFGETVENIADSIIEYGPGVVKAITAITAGLVAMKATQKVREIASLAGSFLQLGTAATTASSAVAAGGAAAMMGPWGLAAAAIGTAVSLVTLAATSAAAAESSLSKSIKNLEASVTESESRFSATKTEIDGAAYAAAHYVERLDELAAAGLNTAESQREYELVVEQLNELVPELNLCIDEQTGLVNKNTDAIRADIDAWKENATAQALQEKFTDVLEARGKAEADLIESRAKLNLLEVEAEDLAKQQQKATEALADAELELVAAQEAYEASLSSNSTAQAAAYSRMEAAEKKAAELSNEVRNLSTSVYANWSSQQHLNAEIIKGEQTLASYSEEIAVAEEAQALLNQETVSGADAQTDYQLAVERTNAAIAELEQAYADATAEARKSIDSQIGLFEELSMESDHSAKKIIENWAKQQEAFANYQANLEKAVDMGLDDALVKQLADGSTESMQILNALVNDTEVSIDEINSAFSNISQGRAALASTLAKIETDFDDSMAALKTSAYSSGANMINGLISGAESRREAFASAVSNVGLYGQEKFNRVMQIRSPAKRMEPSGEFVIEGAMVGAERMTAAYEKTLEGIALAGEKAFLSAQLDRVVAYPTVVQQPASYSRSVAHHYGGQTFQIYQQPGQSGEDLAYEIMAIIQQEVEAKEAGLGG